MNERERSGTAGEILATALIIAGGTSAYGEPVKFENEGGQFDWLFNTLDVTKPVDMQPGVPGTGTAIYMDYFADYYPTFSYEHTYSNDLGASVFTSGFNDNYAAPLDAGTLIDGNLQGGSFNQYFTFEFTFFACDYYDPYDCYYGNRGLLPNGEQTYLGVQLMIDANVHYGWVSVQRNGVFIDVFAWGYETEPGVGILAGNVPNPGALGVLAFGAGAGLLRRPKRAS